MIKKVVSIKGLGQWLDYGARGSDSNFDCTTIVYGDNGSGKTMLAAVLASLSTGEPMLVLGRRSLNHPDSPKISVLTTSGLHTFENGAWDNTYPGLEVFYRGFVDRNVYTGQQVSVDHKRNLCEFVLGRESVELKEHIDSLDKKIRRMNDDIREKENEIRQQIAGAMGVSEFMKLESMPDVETRIKSIRDRISALSRRNELENLPVPSVPEIPRVPAPEDVNGILSTSLHEVSVDALSRVRERLTQLGDQGESWLQYGVEHCVEWECPFCGSNLDHTTLYETYRQYFSERYKEFQDTTEQEVRELRGRLDPASFEKAVMAVQTAQNAALAWSEYCDVKVEKLSTEVEDLLPKWNICFRDLEMALDAKIRDPIEPKELGKSGERAVRNMSNIMSTLDQICRMLEGDRATIREFKNALPGEDGDKLREELERLENVRIRFTEPACQHCEDLSSAYRSKAAAEAEKEEAKRMLGERIEGDVGQYEEDINHLLGAFGASFRIADQRTVYPGGRPGVEYELEICGETVSLSGDASSGEPCLGNTLSEGDKNTLGLAFFLARLRSMDGRDKTVVFDDPATSLDRERRTRTVQEIASLAREGAQVIVLTHDPGLALDIWRNPVISKAGCTSLQVSSLPRSAVLLEWDVEREATSGYFRNYFRLRDYLDSGCGESADVMRISRAFAEDHLRHRFPDQLTHRDNLGLMIKAIREAEEQDPLASMKSRLDDLAQLNTSSTERAHGEERTAVQRPSETEARRIAELAFEVVGLGKRAL